MFTDRKTSDDWFNQLYPNNEIKITDPLGWDKDNFSESWYNEKITKEQFNMRVLLSEIDYEG